MKTQLPEAITSVDEATRFITELYNNNESFHPEDDAFDIIWETTEVSDTEKHQLNKLMNDIYNLPEAWSKDNPEGFDPCAVYMDLLEKSNPELFDEDE